MDSSTLPDNALGFFDQLRKSEQSLRIVVIGDQGSGKTNLVNSLLGDEIAEEVDQGTSAISTFEGTVLGVSVSVYEVSQLSTEEVQQEGEARQLLLSDSPTFLLYCIKLSETRMRQSLIKAFKVFHNAGINWSKTVIALTFADSIPVPSTKRNEPNFDEKVFFTERTNEWKDKISQVLTLEVGVPNETARNIAMFPTTCDPDEMLPSGEEWYSTFWSAMLAAPVQEDAQPSVTTNDCHPTLDIVYTVEPYNVSWPPATHHTEPLLVASGTPLHNSGGIGQSHMHHNVLDATGNCDVEEDTQAEATVKLISRTSVSFSNSGHGNGGHCFSSEYQAAHSIEAADEIATSCSCCML